jgi:hypothetical protein
MKTLQTRRIRENLIEVFKILKGFDHVDEKKIFLRAEGCIRGHDLKLVKPGCHLDCREFAFSNRVINLWNNLPVNVVACYTVNSFKQKLMVI